MKKVIAVLSIWLTLLMFSFSGAHTTTAQGYTERVFVTGYGELTVIDPAIPKVIASVKVKGPTRDLSFTEDGTKALLLANGRTTLYVIDTLQNKVMDEINLTGRTDQGMLDRRVWGSAISPDGSKAYAFVTQGEKRTNIFKALPSKIIEIDLQTKKVTRDLEAPYGIHAMVFKKNDPHTLFVWGYDLYTLDTKQWQLKEKEGIKNGKDGSTNVLLLFPRGDNSKFNSFPTVTTYPDGTVKEGMSWTNLETGEVKKKDFDKEPVGMFSAIIDPDERYGYSIMNHWYKVDAKTGHVIKDVKAPTGTIYGINISTDGKKIYLGGGGNDFIIADTDLNVEKILKTPTDGMDIKVKAIRN